MLYTNFLSVVPCGNHISTRATATRLLGKSHQNPHTKVKVEKKSSHFQTKYVFSMVNIISQKEARFVLFAYLLIEYICKCVSICVHLCFLKIKPKGQNSNPL